MNEDVSSSSEGISCKEWYDFMGQFAVAIPYIHLGGFKATEDLLKMCHFNDHSTVLDIGCGPGTTTCKIAKDYKLQVTGVDFSEQMISEAEKRANKLNLETKVNFHVADATNLPFDNEKFDVAIFESVLTAVRDKHLAMKEACRVIKKGGLIAANETVFNSNLTSGFLELLDEYPSINGHLTIESLKALFEDAGLEILKMEIVLGADVSSSGGDLGLRRTLSFILRNFGKILKRIISDPQYRRIQKIDGKINKELKENGGYVLIVGWKRVE